MNRLSLNDVNLHVILYRNFVSLIEVALSFLLVGAIVGKTSAELYSSTRTAAI